MSTDGRSLYDIKKNQIKNSKILILVKNNRNLTLLSKFLDGEYTACQEYNEDTNYDLILVDGYNYGINFELIKDEKRSQIPLFLPVILMHKRKDTIDYTGQKSNIADEYILTPVKKDVLKTRIQRMLKTRELTKENYQISNKYKKIFNCINDMVFIHKIDLEKRTLYRFTEINKKVIEKTGYSKEELYKRRPTDLVAHDKKSHFFNYYFNKLKKEDEVIVKADLIKKDGDTLNVEINSKMINLDDEEFVLSVLRDLNYRQK